MKILSTILVVFIIIISLLFFDFTLGKYFRGNKIRRSFYPVRYSDIGVFSSGPELYKDFFKEVKEAKSHIHILFYILKDDQFSQNFLSLLQEKAKEGIEVRLMLDRMGSCKVNRNMIETLKKVGIDFSFSNKPKFPFLFYSTQVRNHRKITIIDGKIGYAGGFNIGKEYINLDTELSPWRDYHLKIQGEGVQDLQMIFLKDWVAATNQNLINHPNYFPNLQKGQYKQQFFPTEGFYIDDAFITLMKKAKRNIIIGSPYFIPGKKVFHSLLETLDRGVQLEIILPNKQDHPLVKEASYHYIRELIKRGAKIYHYKKGFYHAKVFVVDDVVCDIGTANFDQRSFYLNLEINCYIYDEQFISQIRELLKKDQNNSKIVDLHDLQNENLWEHCKEWTARAISAFL